MQRCPHCGDVLEYIRNPPRFCSNCGQRLRPSTPDATQPFAPPTRVLDSPSRDTNTPLPEGIGGYRLLRALGAGGMGAVYEGEETATGRRVAVKLIRAEFADSEDAVERFRREGRLASTIAHPRCVFVLAAEEEAGRPYIVMELMPGLNLADLVEKNGPLSPREAVARILDVIEGLQEAHRCGLIHRDVKPSNCFLDSEGRVKIGDFGLSKSLVQDGQLTQSGAFLGTLLYAAPEQIRNEGVVDHLADVYSVAATLYFLLTGRAPFQDTDAAAALARTMTDPVTPMRQLRRDIPTTLDDVVLRGLARPRDKRWQNLEEFRTALLPFVPGRHSLAEVGWRFGAHLFDAVILTAVQFILVFIVFYLIERVLPASDGPLLRPTLIVVTTVAMALLYFGVPESVWGGSVGKLLLRLRVRTVADNDRPGLLRALWRTLLFIVLLMGLSTAAQMFVLVPLQFGGGPRTVTQSVLIVLVDFFAPLVSPLLGGLLIASTMRRGNGYRALHDFLSGTVVIRLPEPRKRALLSAAATPLAHTPMPPETPGRLGAFAVRGRLCATARGELLLGEDSALNRRVWLWLRPEDDADLPGGRREVSRTTRPRWLAGGREGNRRWDAFVASPGFLLTEALRRRPRLFWPEALPILEQLAEELAAACADGTLPRSLSLEQVWIETTGRVQVLDMPPREPSVVLTNPEPEARGFALLRHVAARILEVRPRALNDVSPVRAPLPGGAADVLYRLMTPRGFATVRDVHAALESAHDRPVEVSRTRRAVQVALLTLLVGGGLGWMLVIATQVTMRTHFAAFMGELWIETAVDLLRTTSARDFAALSSTPDPMLTLTAVARADADREHLARLEKKRLHLHGRRDAALESSSWFTRRLVAAFETSTAPALRNNPDLLAGLEKEAPHPRGQVRLIEETYARPFERGNGVTSETLWLLVLALILFPTAWTMWAGVMRGGVGLWLAGMRLVEADGRRAARWRCAWRALLVWLPITMLLATVLIGEEWRLSQPEGAFAGMAWLTWAAWWLVLVLLPLYVWLALRSPHRGWHDRLAGTYLVPR